MTGNSLDAVDVVLTEFAPNFIKDIASHTLSYPEALRQNLLRLRAGLQANLHILPEYADHSFFIETVNSYTHLVAETVNKLLQIAGVSKNEIAAIGFHGQTCGHFPPSIAGGEPPYTLQVGNANLLADETGLPVIYDFRSDDLMNGGEGAPLAPIHNAHLSEKLKSDGIFPVAFCNGGNTGNIALISTDYDNKTVVTGWDVGPFNHLADLIMRDNFNLPFDPDGQYASRGIIRLELLADLFSQAALNAAGKNFYEVRPPKSSDPAWYRLPDISSYPIEDILRTVEYLSVYGFYHTLAHIPPELKMPKHFLVFGGGWKNPLMMNDFKLLLQGKAAVLPQHKELFSSLQKRLGTQCEVCWSDKYGLSGTYMEARLIADLAYCRINQIPFTYPETTGCHTPTVCGIWCYPSSPQQPLYNRAAPGWQEAVEKKPL